MYGVHWAREYLGKLTHPLNAQWQNLHSVGMLSAELVVYCFAAVLPDAEGSLLVSKGMVIKISTGRIEFLGRRSSKATFPATFPAKAIPVYHASTEN